MARPKEFNEHEVITKAVELFRRQGYGATSVRDLLSHTGISSSSLYGAFGGKEALYLRALAAHAEVERTELNALLSGPGNVRDNLRALFDNLIDQLLEEGPAASLTLRAAIELATSMPPVFAFLSTYIQELISMFATHLTDAERRGELTLAQSAKGVAHYLLFSAYNLGFVAKVERSRDTLERYARIVLSVLEAAPPSESAPSGSQR